MAALIGQGWATGWQQEIVMRVGRHISWRVTRGGFWCHAVLLCGIRLVTRRRSVANPLAPLHLWCPPPALPAPPAPPPAPPTSAPASPSTSSSSAFLLSLLGRRLHLLVAGMTSRPPSYLDVIFPPPFRVSTALERL